MNTREEILNELVDLLHQEIDDWYEGESPSRHEASLYLDVANTVGEKLTEVLLLSVE